MTKKILETMLYNWMEDIEQQGTVKAAGDKARKQGKALYKERLNGMRKYFPDHRDMLIDHLELTNGSWGRAGKCRKTAVNWQNSCKKCVRELTNDTFTLSFPDKRASMKNDDWRPVYVPVEAETEESLVDQISALLKGRVNENSALDIRAMVEKAETVFRKAQDAKAAEKKARTKNMDVLSTEYELYRQGIELERYKVACKRARTTLEELKRSGVEVEITKTSIEQLARKMI